MVMAPSGKLAEVMALATEMESGSKPKVRAPNISPVRPKPQITSSEMKRTSYFFSTSATAGK